MSEETKKTARVQAGEEAVETVNEKTLMDQLDSMKTAFRGYDKEATCELLQTLIRSMETEKKEEHRVLLQKNQRLVKEKEALTTQMAELLMKVDSLESENQRMMEQQNTMQKKYEELAEKLSRISENAIERETELSAYHLREQQMKEREAALLKMESQKEADKERVPGGAGGRESRNPCAGRRGSGRGKQSGRAAAEEVTGLPADHQCDTGL